MAVDDASPKTWIAPISLVQKSISKISRSRRFGGHSRKSESFTLYELGRTGDSVYTAIRATLEGMCMITCIESLQKDPDQLVGELV